MGSPKMYFPSSNVGEWSATLVTTSGTACEELGQLIVSDGLCLGGVVTCSASLVVGIERGSQPISSTPLSSLP